LQDAYSRAQQQFNTEQQLREQSRQYGAGLGMQGLQTALSGASQLGGLGSTQFGQQKDVLGLQSVAGAQQQAQEQAKLSQGYEDFLAKEKYPYQQLEFMSNIMRGTPYGTTTSMYSPGPSTASTLLGAGTSLAGAYMMGGGKFFKSGGLADAYAAGGSVDSPDNVQSIADNLSDAQLQQAAAMAQARGDKEQADIIQQEMASRAALRSGAQALPEDQGIGQLPAGNMNYANGGIIAFADGGDVERYNGNSGSWVDNFLYRNITPVEQARRKRLQEEAEARRLPTPYEQERAAHMAGKSYRPEDYGVVAAAPAFQDPRLIGATPINETIGGTAQPLDKVADKTEVIKKGPPAPAPAGLAAAAANAANKAPGPTTIEDLQKKYYGPLDKEFQAQDQSLTELVKAVKEAPKKDLEAIKAEQAARKDVFKAREERLGKREKDLEGMGDKYMGLALLQAGAAMMSTPGGLGMAIGKGVQVGSDRYLSGIEKINQAKEKFEEARDRIEDLRINRDDMNAREIRQAKSAITAAEVKGAELFNAGARDKLNMKSKQIDAVFGAAASALNTDKQIAAERENTLTRERGANARASMLSPNAREAMLLGTGNTDAERYASGLKKLQELTGDKQGMQMLKLFLEENARREKNMEKPLTLEQFRRTSAAFFAPPAAVDTGKPTRP
jgi:hypothetical protein